MKKLMFAAAVAAGLVAFGIESANTVGYSSSPLDEEYGAVLTSPQFIAPGSSNATILLGAVKPVGNAESDLGYNIEIQKLNNWGGTVDGVDYTWDGTKWVDTDTNADASNVQLTAGEGLWVYSMMGEAVAFQSSGEVGEADICFPLDDDYGAAAVANGFPVAVKLNDIVLEAAQGVDLGYNIEIQKLNNWGGTVEGIDYTWDGTKWTDTDTGAAIPDSVVIAPGEGLWVYNMTGEAVIFRIPAPEF